MHSGSHSWAAQYSRSQRGININSVLSITVIMVRFLKGLPQIHIILYSHLPSFSFLGTPSSAPHLSDCFMTLGRPVFLPFPSPSMLTRFCFSDNLESLIKIHSYKIHMAIYEHKWCLDLNFHLLYHLFFFFNSSLSNIRNAGRVSEPVS